MHAFIFGQRQVGHTSSWLEHWEIHVWILKHAVEEKTEKKFKGEKFFFSSTSKSHTNSLGPFFHRTHANDSWCVLVKGEGEREDESAYTFVLARLYVLVYCAERLHGHQYPHHRRYPFFSTSLPLTPHSLCMYGSMCLSKCMCLSPTVCVCKCVYVCVRWCRLHFTASFSSFSLPLSLFLSRSSLSHVCWSFFLLTCLLFYSLTRGKLMSKCTSFASSTWVIYYIHFTHPHPHLSLTHSARRKKNSSSGISGSCECDR